MTTVLQFPCTTFMGMVEQWSSITIHLMGGTSCGVFWACANGKTLLGQHCSCSICLECAVGACVVKCRACEVEKARDDCTIYSEDLL